MDLEKRALKLLQSKKEDDINIGFEYFFEKYSKLAFVCIYNITRNREDSRDLVSDTFLSFFNKRDKLNKEKNIKYYIVTIAKNLAINYLRKNKVEIVIDDDFIYNSIKSEKSELKELMDIFYKYLDEEEISIVFSHLIYALTFEEIASNKNMSVNTVKTKYYRAMKKVKEV